MIGVKKYIGTGSLALAALCATPSESQAFWNWFKGGCCGQTAAPVAVAPVMAPTFAAVPSCNPCQQTVAYVPQTSYRVQMVATPVTSFSPVSSCSPCGGSTTTFMPVTTMQTQTQMVPTTSYRLVYPAAQVAQTSFYTPVTASYAPAAPAASSCCGGATANYASAAPATTAYSAPATYTQPAYAQQNYSQPAYSQPAPAPQTYQQPAYQQPAYQQPTNPQPAYVPPVAAQSTQPQTYANGTVQPSLQNVAPQSTIPSTIPSPTPATPQSSPSDSQNLYKPTPDPQTDAPTAPTSGGPTLTNPARTTLNANDDRWASATAAPQFHTASMRTAGPAIDDGGWRPAR